ncbi:hypothetical protein NHQ30_007332 [Ciborinia camelliae]|nr:hypothetical protein NHQ30_007332 [Ciborinia camelliae]
MKFISLLVLLSFLPIIFATALSTPAVAPTVTNVAVSASSNSFLLRNGLRSEDLGDENKATRTNVEDHPLITAAPTVEEIHLQEKYHLTTYWSCVTLHTYIHCGWDITIPNGYQKEKNVKVNSHVNRHEPVVAGGTEIAGASCGSCNAGRVAMMAAGVVVAAGVL